jgi:uncharacterized SAM-binding protein YcdF (DUF218 family)
MILKLFAYCATALFTLALLWALGWMWFAASVVSMKPYDESVKADAVIVLTGGDKRVNTGLDLLATGKGELLLISGVNEQVKAEELIALWKGDHEKVLCCITLGYGANDTASNATETQEWIKTRNVKSIRLVTSNYHMARSLLMFRNAMPKLAIYKHPVIPDDFEPWGRQFWELTFSEYNKWIATWLRFDLADKNPSLENGFIQ